MKPEISFKEYYTSINQETFKNNEYTNKPKYIKKVIGKLKGVKLEGDEPEDDKSDIRLGKNGNDGSIKFNKNNKIYKSIIGQLPNVSENGNIVNIPDIDTFNKLLSLAIINNGNVDLLSSKIPGKVANYWEAISIVNGDSTNNLSSDDFKKSNKAVINKLKNGEVVETDLKGAEEIKLDKNDDIDKIIIEILNATSNKLTLVMFNELLNVKYNTKNVWSKIFKGDFSGYTGGLSSKNKGNEFEVQLFTALSGEEGAKEAPLNPTDPEIANGLVKAFTGIDGPWGETGNKSKTNTKFIGIKTAVKLTGGANNSRPIKFQGDQPVATISDSEGNVVEDTLNTSVGKTVADLVMVDKNGKEYYISAKYGKLVSFGNLGIRTNLFPKKWFETGKDEDLPKDGSKLLTIFGINPGKFRNIFTSYETKYNEIKNKNDPNLSLRGDGLSNVYAEFDVSDIDKETKTKPKITSHKTTNEVENTSKGKIKNKLVKPKKEDKIADADEYYFSDPDFNKIINFVKSYVGFGYLLVHKSESGHITYTNLMEDTDRDSLLGSIKSYVIRYPDNSKSLSAKRLDIEIEFSNLSFKFNIRPTDGVSIFPTRIDGTYNITGSNFKKSLT